MRNFFKRDVRTPFAYAAAFAFSAFAWLLSKQAQSIGVPSLALFETVSVLLSGAVGGVGPALAAGACGLLSVDYFFIAPAGMFKLPHSAADVVLLAAFAVAGSAGTWLSLVSRRAAGDRSRLDVLETQLGADAVRRDLLLRLNTRALAGGSVEVGGRDAAAITAAAIGVEHCTIFEMPPRGGSLILTAGFGWMDDTMLGLAISRDVDTQAGFALHAHEPVVVADGDSDRRFALPAALKSRGVRSGIAARIGSAGRPWGIVAVYSTSKRSYGAEDAQFVEAVAAMLAGMYERRRLDAERLDLVARDSAHRDAESLALKRAAFLAQTATVFDAALEPETTLVSLARLAVPSLADCAIVDLMHEDGHAHRVDVVDIDPTRRDVTQSVRQQTPNLRESSPFSRAIRTGQPALLSATSGEMSEESGHKRLLDVLDAEALLLVPLVARGQTLGLLTFASRSRKYDAADLAAAQELAGRAAMALDNARLYREARSASRAKDDFLAMVSHELRTPINAVLGWAAMLREHRLDETRAAYAYDAIERSARAQAQLLEQLLDVSRAISGKLELGLGPAHLDAIVQAAVDAVGIEAEDKNVQIMSELDRSIPPMLVDAARLQQVVINVIANAVKFSPEDSVVQVSLRREVGIVEITVQDHGIGIKREFLPYVFERFRQGERKAGAMNRGLGLGMSIARDIVERHGGTIAADSDGEGKGATFTVRLPLRAVTEPSMVAAR